MAVKTTTFTATTAGVAITATIRCRKIEVYEQSGQVAVNHRGPGNGDTGIVIFIGERLVQERPFRGNYMQVYGDTGYFEVGDTAGYIYTNSGTVTMCQRETL